MGGKGRQKTRVVGDERLGAVSLDIPQRRFTCHVRGCCRKDPHKQGLGMHAGKGRKSPGRWSAVEDDGVGQVEV